LRLDLLDLPADGTLGQVELPGGGGEAAKPRHGLEGGERAGGRQQAALDTHDPFLMLIDRRGNFI